MAALSLILQNVDVKKSCTVQMVALDLNDRPEPITAPQFNVLKQALPDGDHVGT
jgi:hypothetical protein